MATPTPPVNTYVAGFSGSVTEITEPTTLPIKGTIPSWLHGAVYRNGPGVFDIPRKHKKTFTFRHWFDGLTVMHKFAIHNGTVTYRNRHLNTPIEEWIAKGHDPPRGFGQDPCRNIFSRLFSVLLGHESFPRDPATGNKANSNVGVTVGTLQGRLVSRTDANALVEIMPEDLQPKPMFTYTDINPAFKGYFSAAHAQYDRTTKQTFNFTLDFPRGQGCYNVFCLPDDDPKGWLLASIPAPAAYIHSMAMTSQYLILIVWPSLINPMALATGKSVLSASSWDPSKGVLFHVVDRHTRDGHGWVASYKMQDAFFCFHNINAYHDEDDIVIDLLAYDDNTVLYEAELSNLRDPAHEKHGLSTKPPLLRRIRLPNITQALAEGPNQHQPATMTTTCNTVELELPRFNIAKQFQAYQYTYGIAAALDGTSVWVDRLAKVDVNTGAVEIWQQPNCYPGEPLFVATPGGAEEDDGVLLSVVLDGIANNSFLVVLDARTMKEIGRATVPQVVTFGFHGNFIDDQGVSLDTN